MQPRPQLVPKRRRARRLLVSSAVLATLAGTALLVQGTAAAVSVRLSSATQPAPLQKSSPGLPRLDTRLAVLARHPQATLAKSAEARQLGLQMQRGRVRVDVTARNVKGASAAVRRQGGAARMIWHAHVILLGPPGSLPEPSRAASVAFVRAPEQGTEESVVGEEVQASLASALHAKGINGQGVKVAIIDGGFLGLSSLQASGDIPANVTTGDFCGGRLSFAT